MKKILLTLVFVASMVTVNANSQKVSENTDEYLDCVQEAWDYGTENGKGNPSDEFQATDQYYNEHCKELE